jgi:hypothetical protein
VPHKRKDKRIFECRSSITACKTCADQLGVTEIFEKPEIEIKYWGRPLTEILKRNEKIRSIDR